MTEIIEGVSNKGKNGGKFAWWHFVEQRTDEESTEQTAGCLFASIRAMLLARIYEINPLVCPRCGGEMRITAFVTELEPVGPILRHIGEPDCAPETSPARDPPEFYLELDQRRRWDTNAVDPAPEFEYDQTVSW